MKIVKFANGDYALRRLVLFWGYEYLDLTDCMRWWITKPSYVRRTFKEVQKAKEIYLKYGQHGKVVRT